MRILLTGATGFIGSHTARALLADGHEVYALVRPESNLWRIVDLQPSLHLIYGDLLDTKLRLPSTPFDLCVHCAWYVEPREYLHSFKNEDYAAASLRLVNALVANNCRRHLVTGTCFEYDLADALKYRRPIDETSRTVPRTRYAEWKLSLLKSLEQLPIGLTWARLFYQYGLMEHPRRLMPEIINNLLRGQPSPPLSIHHICDFLHVTDVAAALASLVRTNATGIINVGSGRPVTPLEIGEEVGRLIGRSDLVQIGLVGDPHFMLADNARLRSTGWTPKIKLETGLSQTIEWWKTQSVQGT